MPEAHLEQVLLIILDNAVKHSEASDAITIVLDRTGEEARIAVIDSGTGIPATDLPYVMDRFYRADKSRSGPKRGHGLGLAIAKRMVEGRGGTITVRSEELRGTTVEVRLPVRERRTGSTAAAR
ncbi:Signal transduction histidine-protein kinase ArlS [compost metagenome]